MSQERFNNLLTVALMIESMQNKGYDTSLLISNDDERFISRELNVYIDNMTPKDLRDWMTNLVQKFINEIKENKR